MAIKPEHRERTTAVSYTHLDVYKRQPYYNKTNQRGLIEHFFTIADHVNLPCIVYNVPSRTGVTIQPETYLALSKHPGIAGAKEASGNFSAIAQTMMLCGDELPIYSGNDDQIEMCIRDRLYGAIYGRNNLFRIIPPVAGRRLRFAVLCGQKDVFLCVWIQTVPGDLEDSAIWRVLRKGDAKHFCKRYSDIQDALCHPCQQYELYHHPAVSYTHLSRAHRGFAPQHQNSL